MDCILQCWLRQLGHIFLRTKRAPKKGPFVLKPRSLGQPGLYGVGAILRFPFLQRFVVAAFCFDDFARVRVFINLQLTRLATAARRNVYASRHDSGFEGNHSNVWSGNESSNNEVPGSHYSATLLYSEHDRIVDISTMHGSGKSSCREFLPL